jgi:hypothetical protein
MRSRNCLRCARRWIRALRKLSCLLIASALCSLTLGSAVLASEPVDYKINSMAEVFDQVCIKSAGDPQRVSELKDPFTFEYHLQNISAGKEKPPFEVHHWSAPGFEISQHGRFLSGLENQCNAVFQVSNLPSYAEVVVTLERVLGSPPVNADREFDKNGKRNKKYKPEWSVRDINGKTLRVVFNMLDLSSQSRGKRLQLTALGARLSD